MRSVCGWAVGGCARRTRVSDASICVRVDHAFTTFTLQMQSTVSGPRLGNPTELNIPELEVARTEGTDCSRRPSKLSLMARTVTVHKPKSYRLTTTLFSRRSNNGFTSCTEYRTLEQWSSHRPLALTMDPNADAYTTRFIQTIR